MSSVERINRAARSYSSQELWAALMLQVRFNHFSGTEIIEDLYSHSYLWSSFIFTRPVYTPDTTGLGIRNLTEILLQMAQRLSSFSNSYAADTLYLLAHRDTSAISTLLSLGEKWQADSVEVIDGNNNKYSRQLQRQLARKLKRNCQRELEAKSIDGLVICYWWDRSDLLCQPNNRTTTNKFN